MKKLIFIPSNEDGTRYNAVIVLKGNYGGIARGKDIPAMCVIEYLQSH